ncbi:MAG: hypothetical protein RTU63_10705 [Candidatus Thorarchaeota archaeon]
MTVFVVMVLVVVVDLVVVRLVRSSLISSMNKYDNNKVEERNSIGEKLHHRYLEIGWKLFVYLSLPMLIFELIFCWVVFYGAILGQTFVWEFWTIQGWMVPFIWGIMGFFAIVRRSLSYDAKVRQSY